jgi:3-phenylpropionate/trans-cinnamate dioxygenase ferredoxin reductase subunit
MSDASQPGMVIVGAGEAGARAASTLREFGYAGPVTIVGDEPYGPYERPPLSKAVMTAEAIERPPMIMDDEWFSQNGIDHIANIQAQRIDLVARQVWLNDGRAISYDKLLIATGASSRHLAIEGASEQNVLYLRTFSDALALRDRLQPGAKLAIIGGGFIGLELAASAINRGCSVTLIEIASRILTRAVPKEVSDLVQRRHEQAGVVFCVGVGLTKIDREGGKQIIRLADGRIVEADLIVAGIGAVPETALAQASGLAVENGVRVDGRLQTSDLSVFAAGDCCSFPHPVYGGRRLRLEAWRNAQDQGAIAARNMLGVSEEYSSVPWFWSDQYEQTLQVAGLPDEGREMVVRDLEGSQLFFHLAEDGRLVAVSGIGPGNAIARDIKIAEILIARKAVPDHVSLASPSVKLKSLL